ncbi:MAG TPA: pilus assembly protein TadG-related protein [Acidimicrobiales bacterium]|nr:pilus assembly protein TadG-related protein [Acidimicrobiales bacterium]
MNRRGSAASRPRRSRGQRGYALWMSAFTMTVLLTASAFAVDLGGLYARASRIQRAADAAAMAGVVWMPGDLARATTEALDIAAKNGFTTGVTVAPVPGNSYRLKVTILDSNVPRFFSVMLSSTPASITRTSTAEFLPTVPLGSPENRLGNDPAAVPPYVANLWASISGPYTDLNNGDAFATKCGAGSSGTGCTQSNTQYRSSGYKYAVDVPADAIGRTLTVAVYDAGNYPRADYANVETADNGSVNTSFEMFDINPQQTDIAGDFAASRSLQGVCTSTPGKFVVLNNTSSATYKNKWVDLCTVTVTKAGTYHIQVKSSAIVNMDGVSVADSGNGWNQFSLKATVSGVGVTPSLYGVGDLSLFNNLPGVSGDIIANFYFAEVDPIYAGKTLTAQLFDPGDGASGDYYVNVIMPGGATTGCSYGVLGGTKTTISPCRVQTRSSSGNTYNGKWLQIDVALPTAYTCSTDCWWKVSYEFLNVAVGSSPNDRTVWSVQLSGHPIHIVE